MSGQERPTLVVVGGWLLVVVFGGLVAVGADEPVSGGHTAEQIAYLGADLTGSGPVTTVLADAFGLLGGLLVVGGAAVALRRRSSRVGEPAR